MTILTNAFVCGGAGGDGEPGGALTPVHSALPTNTNKAL
jgi:hypothetical protein